MRYAPRGSRRPSSLSTTCGRPSPSTGRAETAGPDPEIWAGSLLAEAAQSLDWDHKHWPVLSARLRILLPQTELELDAGRLAGVLDLLDAAPVVFDLDELTAAQAATAERMA